MKGRPEHPHQHCVDSLIGVQEMVKLRKAIEAGNLEYINECVRNVCFNKTLFCHLFEFMRIKSLLRIFTHKTNYEDLQQLKKGAKKDHLKP